MGKGAWRGQRPPQSGVFSSGCFSGAGQGWPSSRGWSRAGRRLQQGNWFKPCKTRRRWPGHDAARPSHRLPGTQSQPAARARHALSPPLLPLRKSCGRAEVRVSLLPAVWKQQRRMQQRGFSAGLYWDVVFLQPTVFLQWLCRAHWMGTIRKYRGKTTCGCSRDSPVLSVQSAPSCCSPCQHPQCCSSPKAAPGAQGAHQAWTSTTLIFHQMMDLLLAMSSLPFPQTLPISYIGCEVTLPAFTQGLGDAA